MSSWFTDYSRTKTNLIHLLKPEVHNKTNLWKDVEWETAIRNVHGKITFMYNLRMANEQGEIQHLMSYLCTNTFHPRERERERKYEANRPDRMAERALNRSHKSLDIVCRVCNKSERFSCSFCASLFFIICTFFFTLNALWCTRSNSRIVQRFTLYVFAGENFVQMSCS